MLRLSPTHPSSGLVPGFGHSLTWPPQLLGGKGVCWANILQASCCTPLRQQNFSSSFSSHPPTPSQLGLLQDPKPFSPREISHPFPLARGTRQEAPRTSVSIWRYVTCSPSGPLSQFSEHQTLSHTCPGADHRAQGRGLWGGHLRNRGGYGEEKPPHLAGRAVPSEWCL